METYDMAAFTYHFTKCSDVRPCPIRQCLLFYVIFYFLPKTIPYFHRATPVIKRIIGFQITLLLIKSKGQYKYYVTARWDESTNYSVTYLCVYFGGEDLLQSSYGKLLKRTFLVVIRKVWSRIRFETFWNSRRFG